MNKKKYLILVGSILLIVVIIGASYSWFNYTRIGENNRLIAGEVYFNYTSGNEQVSLSNIFPETKEEARARNDNYLTFTLSGKNDTSEDLYYEIVLHYGDDKESPYQRYTDGDIKFDLIEIDSNGNEVSYLVSDRSYESINNQRMYVGQVTHNTTANRKFKLRVWVSDDVLISDSSEDRNYCATDGCVEGEVAYKYHYASIKVAVYGDFTPKSYVELYNEVKNGAVIDNENNVAKFINNSTPGINFNAISSDTNGKGVYLRAGTEDDEYPIYYYRGAVTNNNVYFANKCWKIVRTTETGGIKLIYAGDNTGTADAPICNNTTGATTTIMNAPFHGRYQSPAYVGYMYGDVYEWTNAKEATGAYFGTGFNYENGVYSLKGAKVGIDNTHHYTCNLTTADGTCSSIRYYYYYNSDYGTNHDEYYMYITLTNGDSVLDALEKMQKNTNNSNAKTQIDNWYALNMRNYTDRLEDTIWCNDRSIYQLGGWNESGGGLQSYLYFNGVKRRDNTKVPSLECENKNDRFTVSNKKGNKALTYPVALITSDEIMLAGGKAAENTSYYLYTGNSHWSLSPFYFYIHYAYEFIVGSPGYLGSSSVGNSYGLRPSVSLKPGTMIDKGNGTSNNPYVVS